MHQVVSVRLGAGGDSIMVSRTEMLLEHSHPLLGDPDGDLWHEQARALGMSRPRLASREVDDRRRIRPRPGFPRRDGGARPAPDGRGATEFISFGSKSRLPTQMTRAQLDAFLKQERTISLDVRDPIALAYAAERYLTISAVLHELSEGDTIDLARPLLTVSQAAKILGYNAKEVRRLLGQGKIHGRKVGSEWRIPLRAVL
ncbi:MAG TPA: helix-turn-helix domain-containing protein [Chloroflexia bacterium]|nr:helix-turn-helix domain-containing protein [Chloroflexia bacterium]